MEELTEKLSEIKASIDAIRKTGKLSHWRMVYADSLYTRAQEYVAVDRYPEAKLVAQKLDRWIQAHKLALETLLNASVRHSKRKKCSCRLRNAIPSIAV